MKRILQIVAAIAIAVFALLFLSAASELIFFKSGYGYFNKLINNNLPFYVDPRFITAIAIILTVLFFAFVFPAINRVLNPFTERKKKRNAILVTGLFFTALFTMLGVANLGTNFNPDGEALKCVTLYDGEYIDSKCDVEVHPVYGTPVIEVTPEIIRNREFSKITTHQNTSFFNTLTGQAIVYYGRNYNGDIEFFNMDGYHPQTKQRLIPVTPTIVKSYFNEKESNMKKEKTATEQEDVKVIQPTSSNAVSKPSTQPSNTKKPTPKSAPQPYLSLNASIRNTPDKDIALVIKNGDALDFEIMNVIAKQPYANTNVINGLFQANELTDQNFNRLRSGHFETLQLRRHIDELAIGESHYGFRNSVSNNRTTTCTMTVNITIYDTNGSVKKTIRKQVAGVGFSKREAKENALSKITINL